MSNFKIGDKVVVVDGGKSYSMYDEWASRVGLNKWTEDSSLSNKDEGVVVAIAPWDVGSKTILLAVEKNNKQYIIGDEGVEKYVEDTRSPAEMAGLIVGDQYEVVSTDCHAFKMGSVITFSKDDKSAYPVFVAENGDIQCLRPEQVIPYIDTRTPAQKAGLIIGEKYVVIEDDEGIGTSFEIGDIVTYKHDDGTRCPKFESTKSNFTNYLAVTQVQLYAENTVIKFDKVLTEAQIAAIKTLIA
jgi:hypothetical protein